MLALKARVHNGRITMDEPTDLPDGTVLDVITLDSYDELDDEERTELHAAIEDGLSDLRAGRGIDGDDLLAELRAHG
jgi:hypothetical protein